MESGNFTQLNSLPVLITQCAKSSHTEWTCLLPECVAQIYPVQRIQRFRCQVTDSRYSHLFAAAFGPHLFLFWFPVQALADEKFFDPSFLWKIWHQTQRRNTQEHVQQPYCGFIFGSSMWLLAGWYFMGHTLGKQHESSPKVEN